MVLGTFSIGAVSASASDYLVANSVDQQAYKQFTSETSAVKAAIKAKEAELNEQYAYNGLESGTHDGIDVAKINKLEAEIKELKDKLYASAQKHNLTIYSRN